jgi:hypothetical protein
VITPNIGLSQAGEVGPLNRNKDREQDLKVATAYLWEHVRKGLTAPVLSAALEQCLVLEVGRAIVWLQVSASPQVLTL